MPPPAPFKKMKLRYAGTCRDCGSALAAGQIAMYFSADKHVECMSCFDPPAAQSGAPMVADQGSSAQPTRAITGDVAPAADPAPVATESTADVVSGTAGASARREHQRRVAKREQRIRDQHPHLGGLILAVTDEPQSTQAWQRGAVGEEKLARSLDALTERGARVLHDRRIPGSRANIDHILIAPAGVFVIDAKRYKGRPHLRVEGGILRPRVETLMVGSRDCTKLITRIDKQVGLVTAALPPAAAAGGPSVRGMLCFVDADWPLVGGAFTTMGIDILWPKKIAEQALATATLTSQEIVDVHAALAAHFPTA